MTERDITAKFLNVQTAKILTTMTDLSDGQRYAAEIQKRTGVTYSHIVRKLSMIEEQGMIEFEKEGRVKKIIVTDYGEAVADKIEELVKLLQEESDIEPIRMKNQERD